MLHMVTNIYIYSIAIILSMLFYIVLLNIGEMISLTVNVCTVSEDLRLDVGGACGLPCHL